MRNFPKKKGSAQVWALVIIFFSAFILIGGAFVLNYFKGGQRITTKDIASAEKIIGLNFSPKERKMMLEDIKDNRSNYKKIRNIPLENRISPPIHFSPLTSGINLKKENNLFNFSPSEEVSLPSNPEELAFYPVTALSQLIKKRKITSTKLTKLYLKRLKKYGPLLKCVITLTEDLALQQAKKADQEIASGYYRGPLHGIPWGAKDLLATKGIKTTWGAEPYKHQKLDKNATVVQRLHEAGAVLVAKLSMGALAMGDIWYGGKTRNPWNLNEGSSGSSAGSAAATAAGLVGFSIGTETWGSIVSPCTRCGATGLRPTFGRVSRFGAMALSWSMDKIGPICRSVEDCALVFNAIYGPDGKDLTVEDYPFNWDPDQGIKDIKVGYLKKSFHRDYDNKKNDQRSLKLLKSLGLELTPVELPELPVNSLSFILFTEAAASFDELTRSNRDDLLVKQEKNSWPNIFRQARLISAVEYIQANRLRMLLMEKMAEKMKNIDVYVAPTFGGNNLLLTNLTGHPAVVVPNGFDQQGHPTSITFIGSLYEEGKVLTVAKAFQDVTDFHQKHPPLEEDHTLEH